MSKSLIHRTFDGFVNMVARLGIGADNQFSEGSYSLGPYLSRNRIKLESMYRSNWMAGRVVDSVAEDMTRAGTEIISKQTPDEIAQINKTMGELAIWDSLRDCIKWARLYGGSIGYIIVDGQDPATPLRIEMIRKGQFKGIYPLDRWLVQPSFGDLISNYGIDLGKPKYYDVIGDAATLPGIKIHHTRTVRFNGIKLPYYQNQAENLWGESVLERMLDRLVAFDSVTQGAAQLVFKAHLRVALVDGLRDALSDGGEAETAVIKQFEYIRQMQTNEGLTILDAKDRFEAIQYIFSGLAELIMQFAEQISGSTKIPLVKLFGQSPAGLNSTGESDIRNYYDDIKSEEESQLRQPLAQKIYPILSMSVLEKPLPPDFAFNFKPLWQMQDKEKVDMAKGVGDLVVSLKNAGIYSVRDCLKELKQSSGITGIGTNITDEQINTANDKVEEFSDLPMFESGKEGNDNEKD